MNFDPEHGLIVRPLEEFAASCAWMRDQFQAHGISVHGESRVARALAALERFRETVVIDDHYRFDSTEAGYDFMAEIYGMDFLSKAIHWGASCGLQLDERRWRLLGSGDPLITRTTQDSGKPRNETWEIVLASLAATFATDVSFAEPDVTCVYRGRRYEAAPIRGQSVYAAFFSVSIS